MAFSMPPVNTPGAQSWPDLPFDAWRDTLATLHMWTQIVGKIRLVQTPFLNHSWHVTLYVTARGLTTSPIPYGTRIFEIDFDFIDHRLRIRTSDALTRDFALRPCSVADFYRELFRCLAEVGLDIKIHAIPNEVLDAIPFEQNYLDASYDPEYTNRFWRILTQVDRVFKQFRTGFIGKCSPVHFFWGSFDLALTRFSGRTAPPHPGGVPNCPDWVIQEAYSHELSSCGFWPGSDAMPAPVFYAYAYPEPAGFKTVQIRPDTASYDTTLGEFILPYAELRQSHAPDAVLLEFLQSAYEAAANLGQWDRASVERSAYRK